MKNTILVDGPEWNNLLPLTYTRSVGHIRCGIWTIQEKWSHYLEGPVGCYSKPYLNSAFPVSISEENLLINSAILPDKALVEEIKKLSPGSSLNFGQYWVASRMTARATKDFLLSTENLNKSLMAPTRLRVINYPEDILHYNAEEMRHDFTRIRLLSSSEDPGDLPWIRGDDMYVEPGVQIKRATIDSTTGPVYIGKNAVILDGAHIQGPFAIGEGSVVKMGAKIYGATTTGPFCKLGGEIKNSVFFGYSSKSHDGYMGDSIIGEWCNFGAGSSTSNMKNTYGLVSLYHCHTGSRRKTQQQFLGLICGDHSKCAINTAFSTGTVVGVFANIFDFHPRRFVPSFSWGQNEQYTLDKALEVASRAMERKGSTLKEIERQVLIHLYDEA